MQFIQSKRYGDRPWNSQYIDFVKGSGIVLNEPSVIAVNDKGKTLAVGAEQGDAWGKAPANISVVRPLQDGVISDFDRTADMLKAFLETALR